MLLSVPETVNVKVPAAVGVPLIAPPLERVNQAGNAPLASVVEKVYGDVPPLTESDWL